VQLATDDQQSAMASYIQAFVSMLESRNLDPRPIFEAADVPLVMCSDPLKRLSAVQVTRLFRAAASATADPYIGLDISNRLQPSNLHALGFALISSSTLRDYCQRVSRFFRLASQYASYRSYEENGRLILEADVVAQKDFCFENQDVWAALMVRFMRFLYQPCFNPVAIELIRPCPEQGPQPYLDYFRCPVKFDQPCIRIAIDSAVVDLQLPGANAELALQNDEVVMRYLAQLDKQDIVNRVRSLVITSLTSGEVSKQCVADQLHMSARNLQLKLAARQTSFQDILDDARKNLARSYMEQSGLAITEISYMVGFSDLSNFTRAFKRWTGLTPSEFRAARKS
jgi:AraC-like DNA-binding protein